MTTPEPANPKPGLQTQRTRLSWERTAVSFVAVAGVLMLHRDDPLSWDRPMLAALTTTMGLLVLGIGRARGRLPMRTNAAGHSVLRDPQRAVHLIGWATTVLAAAIAVMMMVG
jgi:putative membrane protein